NPNLNDCNNTWQFYYAQLVLRSAFVIDPKFVYSGDLISHAKLQLNPERVTYSINPRAKWNEGVPVTGSDFVFTMQTILNKAWDSKPTGGGITSRVGFDHTRCAKLSFCGTVFPFTYRTIFASCKALSSTYL